MTEISRISTEGISSLTGHPILVEIWIFARMVQIRVNDDPVALFSRQDLAQWLGDPGDDGGLKDLTGSGAWTMDERRRLTLIAPGLCTQPIAEHAETALRESVC
jgi:hypothetical protein